MSERKIKIAWFGKHFGEEPPLTGSSGAGTIFFSGCNLHCVFCQNWQISQQDTGREYSVKELAQIMLNLQKQGAVNIDLVTPSPWRREVKQAIIIAKKNSLQIPVAWNSNAYESVTAIKDLDGLIDIYLPDFKYGDDFAAAKYSRAPKYSEVAEKAIREMYRQVGLLETDENGLAKKGLIIRHLILPDNLKNTFAALEKIAAIDKNIHLSLMSQYHPVYNSAEFPELNRPVSAAEIIAAENKKLELGLGNGWTQEADASEIFLPNFLQKNPFRQD
ncbi:MAG: radical SAM protein [Patescibacteria group bacterium]|nr:radical SAM protein [Patescibacteria group bacterium]